MCEQTYLKKSEAFCQEETLTLYSKVFVIFSLRNAYLSSNFKSSRIQLKAMETQLVYEGLKVSQTEKEKKECFQMCLKLMTKLLVVEKMTNILHNF